MTEDDQRDLERGPKGDHGQDGRRGLRGDPAPPVVSWLVAVVLFTSILAVAGVLTYLSTQQTQIAKSRAAVACEQSNKNSRAINDFLELQAVKDPARASDYRALKVTVVDC